MPNWTHNFVKMNRIHKEDLFTIGEDGKSNFDFNKLVPMPESLNITHGSDDDFAILYYLSEKMTDSDFLVNPQSQNTILAKTLVVNMFDKNWTEHCYQRLKEQPQYCHDDTYNKGKQYVENYKLYGATTWYNWCYDNWGTKWNASETLIQKDEVCFYTPWSVPEGIMTALSKRFPDREIQWEGIYEEGYTEIHKYDPQTKEWNLAEVRNDFELEEESECETESYYENKQIFH